MADEKNDEVAELERMAKAQEMDPEDAEEAEGE